MAIKVYGDKIVFPDNTEQTTAGGGTPTDVYTKEEIDQQQNAQDTKIDKNTSDLTNVYTKTEVDDSQSDQDTEIAKKLSDAPDDGEQYVRKDGVWAELAAADGGITDAPADGKTYGRKDLKWEEVTSDAYTESETDALLDDKADKSTTYTKTEVDNSQDAQDNAIANNTIAIQTNTDAIAALPAPVDTYTKTEIDTQQNAQDVEIAKKANTADTYTKTQTDTLLDNKANVGDSYTKAETYNNTEIDSKLFEKADKTTTYTKDEVNTSQDAQDVNISGNTSAIGTLSGRVSANEQDIATLQDGIFFSSSYTAEYPDNPNRDPQTGNMYMQDLSAFTYSYADTNQVFLSKTDEQGNVRQFTAVKPDDTIVLNQVESPNYGRYKVVSVNDVGAYVSLVVVFQIGEGTLLEGDTVALQAFPASAGGSGGIPEAPIDGKQYGRQDAEWTEVTGGEATGTPSSFARIVDEKPENTDGGASIAGTQTRTLNKIEYDADNIVTLSDDKEFTLQSGTYVINFSAPNYKTAEGNSYLYSVTDDKRVAQGQAIFTSETGQGSDHSYGTYYVTLTEPHTYRIDNYTAVVNGNGLGVRCKKGASIFTSVDIQKVGTGGSASGGGGTPEKMVWEITNDPIRTFDTVYTNDDDAPRFVNINIKYYYGGASSCVFYIDGEEIAEMGRTQIPEDDPQHLYTTQMFVIPSGSTYELKKVAQSNISQWWEAKMPVAVGTGDSIWTEEDGKATYDGDIEVNGVTVGQGSGTNDKNTVLGISCLENTSGVQNTAIGFNSLIADTTGTRNTAVGYASLNTLTEGEYNTSIGHLSGSSLTTGNNNTVIGHNAQPSSPTASNEVTIGNDSVTKTRLRGNVSISSQLTVNDNLNINTGELLVPDMSTTAQPSNVYIDGKGQFYKSTTAFYSADDVDKKLAIKDKLIEKMSARLDELEKKVK